jgi:hypothetical protein
MNRYIDADALLSKLPDDLPYKASVKRVLMQSPTADVAPVRHGCWIWEFNLDGDDFFVCSVCGDQVVLNGLCKERSPVEHYPYCHCGAKMDGERRSENEG